MLLPATKFRSASVQNLSKYLFQGDTWSLALKICLCRYVVYCLLIAFITAHAYQVMQSLPLEVALLVVMPGVIHLAQNLLQQKQSQWIAVMESLLGLSLLWWLSAPPSVWAFLSMALIASSTALWGMWSLPVATTIAAACVIGVNTWHFGLASPGLNAVVILSSLLLLVAINGVIRSHVLHLLRHGERLHYQREQLLKYLPGEVSQRVRDGALRQTQRLWYTVAFIDLRGFTQATESMPPEDLHLLLSDFLGEANLFIEDLGGDVAKFLGDGLLCVFPCPDVHARGLVATSCVKGLQRLPEWMGALNDRWQKQGHLCQFSVSAGVASGFCTYGEWGHGERLDYTLVGSAVNLASRLQNLAAEQCADNTKAALLIDPVTAQIITPHVAPGARVPVSVKGSTVTQAYQPLPV